EQDRVALGPLVVQALVGGDAVEDLQAEIQEKELVQAFRRHGARKRGVQARCQRIRAEFSTPRGSQVTAAYRGRRITAQRGARSPCPPPCAGPPHASRPATASAARSPSRASRRSTAPCAARACGARPRSAPPARAASRPGRAP